MPRWIFTALAVSSLAAATQLCSNQSRDKILTAATSSGLVTGHIAPETSCVVEYLGIAYAKPPVGELRFAPPHPIDNQSDYIAANFGFDCPLSPSKPANYPKLTPQAQRVINYFASGAGTPQDEDCLTLNIWSKATPKAAVAKKPVLIFFYGGRQFPNALMSRRKLIKSRLHHWQHQQPFLQRQAPRRQ